MLKALFKRPKKVAVEDVKNIVRAQITGYRMKQSMHKSGSDFWNRYQSQINALHDLKESIDNNLNK